MDKKSAAERLQAYVNAHFGQSFRFVDFEKQFLKESIRRNDLRSWTAFLDSDFGRQASVWRDAWQNYASTLDHETTVLSLHATYVSAIMGLRCPIDLPKICDDFRPTLIITLIDDVPTMWRRTEERAKGRDNAGRPTVEQLLSSRRAEQILGDMIVTHSAGRDVPHVLCATGNTLAALANIIIFGADIVYLSFPISVPREMKRDKDDNSFIDIINEAHRLAAETMNSNRKRAFISPLAIDELPILEVAKTEPSEVIAYDCSQSRWGLKELWGQHQEPVVAPPSGIFQFPKSQIDWASGNIKTDVGWRDRRLVRQSKSLAVICPKDLEENRITRGVDDEITTAMTAQIPFCYWQKPEWDPENFLGTRFQPAGSMGPGYVQMLFRRADSLPELIAAEP